jgi:hypothetical protein
LYGIDDQVAQAGQFSAEESARLRGAYQGFYRTEFGLPYTYDYDSYYFLERAARGDHGGSLLILLEWLAYRSQPGLTPSDASFFLPMLFGLLTLTAFFFLAKKVAGSIEAAFFAAFILALQHRFFGATAAGMGDTQSISLLFSVTFFLLVVHAYDAWGKKQARRAAALSAAAAVVFALFFLTWQGAVYVLAVAAVAAVIACAIRLWKARSWSRMGALAVLSIAAAWLFSVTPLGMRAIRYLQPGQYGAVARNIGELYNNDPVVFVAALGGWIVLAAAAVGALLMLRKGARAEFSSLLIVCWFALLAFATYQAVRFMYYALPPVSLLAGVALYKAVETARSRFGSAPWKRVAVSVLAIIVIGVVMLPYLLQSHRVMLPKMNDAIASVGVRIDETTPPGTTIISWWDYGHMWRYAARREPYLQGQQRGTESDRSLVWLAARTFLSDNITESKNGWTALMCRDREWVAGHIGAREVFANAHSCPSPQEAAVIFDEAMLGLAPNMLEVVAELDPSFAVGPVWVTSPQSCAQAGSALACGDLRIDLSAKSSADGKQVHLYGNGTRAGAKASGDVVVVYPASGGYAAFATSGWLAETMLVRLFAGERFGMEPLAVAEDPIRAVAYRFRQG